VDVGSLIHHPHVFRDFRVWVGVCFDFGLGAWGEACCTGPRPHRVHGTGGGGLEHDNLAPEFGLAIPPVG